MDFLAKAVAAVIPSCVNPVWDNIAYPFNVSDNVRALDLVTRTLVAAQADIRSKVEGVAKQGLSPSALVTDWLGQVDTRRGEADEITRRYAERCRCLGGRSFNCWSNYWISKDAARKLREVQELNDRHNFDQVDNGLPPQVHELPVERNVGLEEEPDFQKIRGYIDNDDYDIIAIWGMGGVGKTRLLHQIHNSYKQSGAFGDVIFVTASRECSVKKVQTQLREKYHIGDPGSSSVEPQATIISNYLGERSFLLLLDDVWDRIDLKKVGIPYPLGRVNNSIKRKVVITTRSSVVFGQMAVKQSHMVVPLNFNDARSLFFQNVGEGTIHSHPLISSLAEEVVKELDGLPLALITIGRAMHGKNDPTEWEDAIDLLQKSCQHEIEPTCDEEKTYYRLKLSYDSLETEELKDCFLACSLWPEDDVIPKIDLIECWMGLGILNTSDGPNIYRPGYTLIGKLLRACLLEHVESDSDGLDSVKMHDIIRDMAVWLACDLGTHRDKWIVRTGDGVNQVLHEKDRWRDTERAALLWPDEDKKPKSIPCDANKLQFLKVLCFNNKGFLGPLVENLKLFPALTFLHLGGSLVSFPPDIFNLVNLRYLNLSETNISSVPEELKLLRNLRCLFLAHNNIVSFPQGIISELRELRILNLFPISDRSKKEYFTWLIEELLFLHNIKSLGIQLQHPAHLESLLNLPYLPIRFLLIEYLDDEINSLEIPSKFVANRAIQDNLCEAYIGGQFVKEIIIENLFQRSPCHLKLESLVLERMTTLEKIIWRGVKPKDLFEKLRMISITECHKLKDISWVLLGVSNDYNDHENIELR